MLQTDGLEPFPHTAVFFRIRFLDLPWSQPAKLDRAYRIRRKRKTRTHTVSGTASRVSTHPPWSWSLKP